MYNNINFEDLENYNNIYLNLKSVKNKLYNLEKKYKMKNKIEYVFDDNLPEIPISNLVLNMDETDWEMIISSGTYNTYGKFNFVVFKEKIIKFQIIEMENKNKKCIPLSFKEVPEELFSLPVTSNKSFSERQKVYAFREKLNNM